MAIEEAEQTESLVPLIGEARSNAAALSRLDEAIGRERKRRVGLVKRLASSGMNFAQIGEIYGLSKQRISSVLHPTRKET